MVGEDPELEAAEVGGEVGGGFVGVFEVVEPHVGAEGDSVFFEEVGWVVGIWGLALVVRGEVGEGADGSDDEGEDARRGVFEPFGWAYDREASTHFLCVLGKLDGDYGVRTIEELN